VESKDLLAFFGISVNPTKIAGSLEEAVQSAEDLGFPVVMNVLSREISHKTEVNRVQPDLRSAKDVRRGYRKIMEGARAHNPDAEILGVVRAIRDPDQQQLELRDPWYPCSISSK